MFFLYSWWLSWKLLRQEQTTPVHTKQNRTTANINYTNYNKYTKEHQTTPPNYNKLHRTTTKYSKLHQTTLNNNKLHQTKTNCTNYSKPNCTKPHRTTPNYKKIHRTTTNYTKLHRTTTNYTELSTTNYSWLPITRTLANSNQNRLLLDFHRTFTVSNLTLGNSNPQ